MSLKKSHFGAFCGLLLAIFVSLTPVRAQQESAPPPPKEDQPKPAGSSGVLLPSEQDKDTDLPPESQGPLNPYSGTIKSADTGLPLFGTSSSPLRWGSFSICTFQYVGIHDDFDPAGSPTTLTTDLTILRTGLMFDHYLFKHKSRIVLQYFPQMAITNGQIHANAAMNNTISVGTKLELTPRLSVSVEDGFLQVHSNPLIPQNFLAVDGQTGATVQNNFLDTAGSFIADTAQAVFDYALTPLTNMTFSPLYRYSRATNSLPNYLANGQTYAGEVTLGHKFTPRRTVGILDSFQYLQEGTFGTTQSATYNTIGAFYTEQLTRSLWVSANAGALSQGFSDLPQANNWGFNGGFSVVDNFTNRINLSIAYTRGLTFNNYITLQRSDRVDASLGLKLSSRISWSNGFGYYRELGGNPNTDGKYASADLRYRFYGNFSFFTTYAYTFLSANTPQLLSGERRTLAYGVLWAPPLLFGR